MFLFRLQTHPDGELYLRDEHGLELQLVEEDRSDVGGGGARCDRHVDPLLLERAHDALGVPIQARRVPLGAAVAEESKIQSDGVQSPNFLCYEVMEHTTYQ